MRVLVVDDDSAACSGLVSLLNEAGYDARGATSFHDAKEMLRADRPDLMVVDIRLGQFNGLQLLIESDVPIPTIIVSGYFDATLAAEARKFGADYLEKPIDSAALFGLIERKLKIA